jgi:hypothetical protein
LGKIIKKKINKNLLNGRGRMNKEPIKDAINPRIKALIAITGLIIVGIIIGYIISFISLEVLIEEIDNLPIQIDQSRITRSIDYYTGAVIILTIELILLIGVLFIYFKSYRETKSRFLVVLNVFIIALVIKSALSIISLYTIATEYIQVMPYVSRTFFTPGFGILNFILTAFEIIAISILVYLSMD